MSKIRTICKSCCFATWDANTQEDCSLGRLNKFEEQGVTLTPESSGGKLYFSIDTYCNSCRTEDSLKDIPRRKWRSHVEAEIAVKCEMVVVAEYANNPEDTKETIKSILAQTLPASQLTVATNNQVIADKILPYLKSLGDTIPWSLVSVDSEFDYHKIIDHTLKTSKQQYYSVCRTGYAYPPNYLEKINHALNVDLQKFVAIRPNANGNALFVQTLLHNKLEGNRGADILTKVTDLAEDQNLTHMIKDGDEL